MKKICTLLILGLIAGASFGQSRNDGGTVFKFDAGVSFPMGDYGYSGLGDTLSEGSGYAKAGFFVQPALYWMGKHDIGLGVTYIFQWNPLSKEAEDFVPEGQSVALGTRPWSNHYIMAGPYLKTYLGRHLFIDAAVHAGLLISSSSNFTITTPAVDSLSTPSTSTSPGMGWGYQVKAGAGWELTKKLGLALDFSYLGGNATRNKSYYYYSYVYDKNLEKWVAVYQGGEIEIKKTISSFNINLSLVVKL